MAMRPTLAPHPVITGLDIFIMASSWELDRGKTGDTTTVGEAIDSTVLAAVTITAAVDIPEEEVLLPLTAILLRTAPDRHITMARTTAATPQSCIPMAKPRIATAATPRSCIPTVKPRIAKALLPKSRITMAERRIVRALLPTSPIAVLGVPLMVAVNRTAAEAMNITNRQGG
jgi:hypothetical protein